MPQHTCGGQKTTVKLIWGLNLGHQACIVSTFTRIGPTNVQNENNFNLKSVLQS